MKVLKEYIIITFGLFLVAASLAFFLVPNNLAAGGVSGLAMVINNYLPMINVGTIMLLLNVVLFVVGFIFIGKGFGVKTIYSSIVLSLLTSLLEYLFPMTSPLGNDLMINLLFGILISAVGMAIVFNENASTGGTDIIAKILNKYLKIDIGKGLLLADLIVTLLALRAFGATIGMYSIFGVIINGFVVDGAISGMNIIKKVEIISNEAEMIRKFIIEELDRSATIYYAKGAYTLEETKVITAVLGKREFIRLKSYIKEVDPKAFIISYNVHEILGEGFGNIMD